jgi:L-lactate dehydrogenase complex protein LldE
MQVGLFIPCYVDAFYPEVGIATLELLERLRIDVVYPLEQTCCGQMMANSGSQKDAAGAEALFVKNFGEFDHIVTPSGSCAFHVREHLDAIAQTPAVEKVRRNTYELVEFLHDVLKVDSFPWAEFPHKVGLHNACSHAAQAAHGKSVGDRGAVLFQAARSSAQGARHRARRAEPA